MMAVMAQTPFGRVTLVTGAEELLAERAVHRIIAAARTEDPDVEVSDITGDSIDLGTLWARTGSSLFATRSVLVVHQLADAPADVADALIELAKKPLPDVALILTHPGGQKGKGTIAKLKKAGVDVIECDKKKAWELPAFVEQEARSCGGRLDSRLSALLVECVGTDMRALAAAVRQLFADADGQVTEEFIHRYFGGRAETSSFAVADAALNGNANQALGHLRWALATGVAPVLVTSALTSGIRGLAKLATTTVVGRDAQVAADVGVPPWKIKSMRQQLRGWDTGRLAAAIDIVTRADMDVKGGADDAHYALERAVLRISALGRR